MEPHSRDYKIQRMDTSQAKAVLAECQCSTDATTRPFAPLLPRPTSITSWVVNKKCHIFLVQKRTKALPVLHPPHAHTGVPRLKRPSTPSILAVSAKEIVAACVYCIFRRDLQNQGSTLPRTLSTLREVRQCTPTSRHQRRKYRQIKN